LNFVPERLNARALSQIRELCKMVLSDLWPREEMKPNSVIRFAGALACAGVLHLSPASAATETVLYAFKGGSDGSTPVASLIDVNGTLYGTTESGAGTGCGGTGCGTVFAVSPNGTETVLYAFTGGRDGGNPVAGLISVSGTLYGTTSSTGGDGCVHGECGAVFSITPSGTLTVLHTFKGGNDGAEPYGSLINVDGTFYGTTTLGGLGGTTRCNGAGCGTVFSITTSGTETVLYAFGGGICGAAPGAGLTKVGGLLYGTTLAGGGRGNGKHCYPYDDNGGGTVFSVTKRGRHKVLYSFEGSSVPSGLIYFEGALYGTTYVPDGTVFSLDPATGAESTLYTFTDDLKGRNPFAALVRVGAKLVGTTTRGGIGGKPCYHACGAVFSITRGGREGELYRFKGGNDGAYPFAGLIYVNGILYGTTSGGGASGAGTVFSITP
jgi:uncharacterized repeat protein (TIGR03803 family)